MTYTVQNKPVRIPPELPGKVAHGVGGIVIQPGLIPERDTLVAGAREIGWLVGLGSAYRGSVSTCTRASESHAG